MKRVILSIILIFISATIVCNARETEITSFKGETISLVTIDGLNIKADIYEIKDKKAPVILLFHQARFSRGEYRETAPKLNALGFNCIAIDQRSGKNEAFIDASVKGLGTKYNDALPDLEAVLKFTEKRYPSSKIIVLGSSYSASLVFVLAQKYPDKISALIAFSPGEYFKFEGKKIEEFAGKVKCPVFITSAKNEHRYWKGIYDNIENDKKSFFLPESDGVHGSKALWKSNKNSKEYWRTLKTFLSKIKHG